MNKAKIKFIAVISSIAAILLIIMLVLQIVMYKNKGVMDSVFGMGERVDVKADDSLTGDYIDYKYDNLTDAAKYAQDVTRQVAEEGMVLLKNEDSALPLAKGTKVTLLDYWGWHNNMAGGEDPATTRGAVSLYRGIWEDKDIEVNEANLKDSTSKDLAGNGIPSKDSNALGNSIKFGSVASTLDNALKDTAKDYNTAIVTIKRNSGEGNDQSKYITTEGENYRTGLTLTRAEMQLIDYANKNFDKVILLINSVNTMELGFLDEDDPNMDENQVYTDPWDTGVTMDCSKIVAALWVGGCGSQAGYAVANILTGDVNPSGHLSDLYARDLTADPTFNNMSSQNGSGDDVVIHKYSNSANLNSYAASTYFSEYEEGIYIGYRYHETAAAEAAKGNYEGYDYDEAVVYPFGYGLSYTTFSYEYAEPFTYDEATETFTFKVTVTNTGKVAGKGVAQIYVNVPWEKGQVEKAHVVLGGFAKTDILEPGEPETVTIEIKKDYFTSYDYITEKAYLLDKGDYKFYLASDELGSHSWTAVDKLTGDAQDKVLQVYKQTEKVVYNEEHGKRVTDEVVATNIMDDELNGKFKSYKEGSTGDGYIHDFSREDFAASFPTAPKDKDFVLTGDYNLQYVQKYNVWQDTDNNVDEDGNPIDQSKVPETNVDETNYTLADMRGVDIDSDKWDDYINQFTVDSMENMFGNGGWGQPGDEDNGVPATLDLDSPYGYYSMRDGIGSGSGQNTWYCSAPMLAATFNIELAKKVGDAFGEEAYQLRSTSGLYATGLYGFGMNQHRSAFGGRNYEYYSEDPVLCGKMGMSEAEGASEKGLVVYMKHFVLNDQESYRQANGYCAWVNEQAFREVYLRAWEIYMKEATATIKYYTVDTQTNSYKMAEKDISAATGIMTCYNRIGTTYGGASVSINGILRREWNFTGTVVTDAGGQKSTYMTTDLALRRGQNLCLTDNGSSPNDSLYDTQSPTAVYWLKNSTKYLLYNIANSNAMQGVAPGDTFYYLASPWQTALVVCWVVVGILAVAAVVVDVLVAKDVIKLKEKQKKQKSSDEYDEY